jgi:hypothetical protein
VKGRHRARLMEEHREGVDWHSQGGEVTWPIAIGLAFALFAPLAFTTGLFFML